MAAGAMIWMHVKLDVVGPHFGGMNTSRSGFFFIWNEAIFISFICFYMVSRSVYKFQLKMSNNL